jgi:tRNA pseudouridine55 synthase
MARRRRRGRSLDGILVLDKPKGLSSNEALQRAKWLLAAAKAGHTGSLDPMATGVLPLCFGEATKFSQFLLDSDKAYRATFTFGKRSETGDSEGELLHSDGAESLTREQVDARLDDFRGEILQVPSMYSAIKHEGQPLYKLARQGIVVEREARKVHIYSLEVVDFRPGRYPELDVEVRCSKGTYIRSLAEDLGEALECGALVSALHRSAAGPFTDEDSISLQDLEQERGEGRAEVLDHHLLPVDTAIGHLQEVVLPESSGFYLKQGQPVIEASALRGTETGDYVRVFMTSGEFLGVAEILDDGRVAPRRLMTG